MKQLFLAIALIATTFSSAFAGGRLTKAENEAAMKAGHEALAAKVVQFESTLKANNTQSIESVATEIQQLMRKGMQQYMYKVTLEQGNQQTAAENHYRQLESVNHSYNQLISANASTNGTQLLSKAKDFLKLY
jgi:hypothetical protein